MIDLAEREGDIELLTDHFIKKFNHKFYKNIQGVSKEVKNIFKRYDWPGNVRELENIIEGIISVSDKNIITKDDLPKPIINKYRKFQSEIKSFNLKDELETIERDYIQNAMKQTGQNITESAKLLGIPRQTLQYKLSKYNL
jgi:arginine utilization regulatory protein